MRGVVLWHMDMIRRFYEVLVVDLRGGVPSQGGKTALAATSIAPRYARRHDSTAKCHNPEATIQTTRTPTCLSWTCFPERAPRTNPLLGRWGTGRGSTSPRTLHEFLSLQSRSFLDDYVLLFSDYFNGIAGRGRPACFSYRMPVGNTVPAHHVST